MAKVLVADDERSICEAFTEFLKREGHTPLVASNGNEALAVIEREHPDAVFLDVRMPGRDGISTLKEIAARNPELPVIVMTAYGTLETAMEAMRQNAFDYLGKPVDLPRVRSLLAKALHRSPEPAPGEAPAAALETPAQGLVGQSAAMQEVFKLMGLLTGNELTVLITGESGVGKELVARGIHDNSPRASRPFVAVNCAAIPETLIESELFGHEKGAFTDARDTKIGRFEAAGDGTLFLDEVSELPYHLQSKLLRVLQEKSFERVGSVTPTAFKGRLITASNQDLGALTKAGEFREDLYHRLNLAGLRIPPLRERSEDIPLLASHFLRHANQELGKQLQGIDENAIEMLKAYAWPGNVRELEHSIKRAALVARGSMLTHHDLQLPGSAGDASAEAREGNLESLREALRDRLGAMLESPESVASEGALYQSIVGCVETELVEAALRKTGGNQVAAAKLLGINRTTLRSKLHKDDD